MTNYDVWKILGNLSFRELSEISQQIIESCDREVPNEILELASLLAEISKNVTDEIDAEDEAT